MRCFKFEFCLKFGKGEITAVSCRKMTVKPAVFIGICDPWGGSGFDLMGCD